MTSFSPSQDELRRLVERRLSEVWAERTAALPEAAPLLEALAAVTAAGGKRLRPAFCYWGYRAAGGRHRPEIVKVAASLELLHTFAIVHDDIMDDAVERRGVPSVNAAHGPDVALLAGDLALVLADDLFMHSGFSPVDVARGFGCYSRMRQEVIAGQFLDFQASRAHEIDESQARRIAVLKSGRYSVEEPLLIGAVFAGASDVLVEKLSIFAAPLGEAFQLRDDLLGTFGTTASTGKSVDSDIRQGKRNILFAATLARLSGDDRRFFLEHWGRGDRLRGDEIDRLRRFVIDSGARAAVESLLAELFDRVRASLEDLDIDEESRAALMDLATVAVERES